jgi:hypothetical protein
MGSVGAAREKEDHFKALKMKRTHQSGTCIRLPGMHWARLELFIAISDTSPYLVKVLA